MMGNTGLYVVILGDTGLYCVILGDNPGAIRMEIAIMMARPLS